ncbi:precorrin-3B C(17)-methyltransferase [Streptomyces marispadix]|uniref:Precorrin-3B C(17)-methyltransferase n=1 Tax=Streptomyces marispadix TaxID=2922868 RepID=A0ABS9STK3_9ACTN|nr:precorrin-3B C(17)-methyltransferase [Streptomyces marispadix]MCH6159597.1 precorrin-3B C(17)-methyltransferase [Streptomyces marispadix]
MIGLISATAAGASARDRLNAAWPDRTRVYETRVHEDMTVREAVARAFRECDAVVCFLAAGAVVRLLAPLLSGKSTDPGVVCVDEAQQHAVALLGGHEGGANDLARAVAEALPGCEPVITTATDAAGVPGLDSLGWPVEGAVPSVTRAILDGTRVALRATAQWPLPAFPGHVVPLPSPRETADGDGDGDGDGRGSAPDGERDESRTANASLNSGPTPTLWVTDEILPLGPDEAVLRPPSLTVGVGASRGVSGDEVVELIERTLDEAGLSVRSVTELATVDAKAGEPGLLTAADRLDLPLRTYSADVLADVEVPNPSEAPRAAVGTPSVAEAAALTAAGPDGRLIVPKSKSVPLDGTPAMATAAVARRRPRGRLALVGLGPGARDLLTPRARDELRRASVLVGLDQYVEQIRDLLRPGTRVLESGLGSEEERARTAVAEARAGRAVALVGSGDAGVYAMASPALAEAGGDIDVVGVPGVTAALAAAAVLGAPLGHDHVSISLSDLHTPWEVIERRVRAAAESDTVVTFYNPRSRGRHWQLPKALGILSEHRSPGTPVGVVRNASRRDEQATLTTLGALDPSVVDMMTVVTVGNTATRTVAGRMVTPRGYRWQS